MAGARFDILFAGELMGKADPDRVRHNLRQHFKLSDEAAARLFSGHTITVKRGVDIATASHYRALFREAGALIQIRPVEAVREPSSVSPVQAASASSDGPQDGSAGSHPEEPRLHLAAQEREVPREQPPVADSQAVDISHLSLVPGWDWTLEDCQPPPQPVKLPDISHLALVVPAPDSGEEREG